MQELFPGYEFPLAGWKSDGSTSYGRDYLYRGMEHVLVRLFPEDEQFSAYGTHFFLKELGVTSTEVFKIRHVTDNKQYYYVFAERDEMLAKRDQAFPGITIDGRLR